MSNFECGHCGARGLKDAAIFGDTFSDSLENFGPRQGFPKKTTMSAKRGSQKSVNPLATSLRIKSKLLYGTEIKILTRAALSRILTIANLEKHKRMSRNP